VINEIMAAQTRGKGTLEVLNLKEMEEGDDRLEN
jgi:hypothetical protein